MNYTLLSSVEEEERWTTLLETVEDVKKRILSNLSVEALRSLTLCNRTLQKMIENYARCEGSFMLHLGVNDPDLVTKVDWPDSHLIFGHEAISSWSLNLSDSVVFFRGQILDLQTRQESEFSVTRDDLKTSGFFEDLTYYQLPEEKARVKSYHLKSEKRILELSLEDTRWILVYDRRTSAVFCSRPIKCSVEDQAFFLKSCAIVKEVNGYLGAVHYEKRERNMAKRGTPRTKRLLATGLNLPVEEEEGDNVENDVRFCDSEDSIIAECQKNERRTFHFVEFSSLMRSSEEIFGTEGRSLQVLDIRRDKALLYDCAKRQVSLKSLQDDKNEVLLLTEEGNASWKGKLIRDGERTIAMLGLDLDMIIFLLDGGEVTHKLTFPFKIGPYHRVSMRENVLLMSSPKGVDVVDLKLRRRIFLRNEDTKYFARFSNDGDLTLLSARQTDICSRKWNFN